MPHLDGASLAPGALTAPRKEKARAVHKTVEPGELCPSLAPNVGFASGCAITMIAKTALERAGIRGYAHQGAHIFRHSLATELLRSGATLSEIGQLLRHDSHDTTRIYAKVDIEALRTLSLPWPGGVQ